MPLLGRPHSTILEERCSQCKGLHSSGIFLILSLLRFQLLLLLLHSLLILFFMLCLHLAPDLLMH